MTMNLLLALYDRICWSLCRHEWVRERRDGKLYECCMKCMKRQPDRMTAIVHWTPRYKPLEPITVAEVPPPLAQPLRRAA
jgi:hypothetical protein